LFPSGHSGIFGRASTIAKELAMLTTSIPDGVFVKVAESRSDAMKILMIGVKETPYAGGLFTFDMILPLSYPQSPPIMKFTLEKADQDGLAMNPNLQCVYFS
jgi:ubiquitin-protein ligase